MSLGENLERMAEDNAHHIRLLKGALIVLRSLVGNIKWSQGQEGDGYKQSETVYRATIPSPQKAALEQAEHQADLVIQGKSPEDAKRESAARVLEAARQKVRDAEAEVARLQAEASA